MCGSTEQLDSKNLGSSASEESKSESKTMEKSVGVEIEFSFSAVLELAADNNVDGFRKYLCDASVINKIGLWYERQRILRKMVIEQRTPLMVAAKYGSSEVLKLILSVPDVNVNLHCGLDKITALHCAASGGSSNAIDIVKLLLDAGADPSSIDAYGYRPFDVIVAAHGFPRMKDVLEEILRTNISTCEPDLRASSASLESSFTSLSSSSDGGSLSHLSDSVLPPVVCKPGDGDGPSLPEKKEYPIDPSLPDIKSSMYATDEFRMFSFKIRPCSRAYSHDWTECPFAHPGENARRRDPRKFHYSCVPCPDFRKGTCKRGDMCEYAHGVFESWLHPAQYRTQLCKDGTSCNRRVCFFAHTPEELRPLYPSTGSGLPSPRAASLSMSTMDMAAVINMLPGSPSAMSSMAPSTFTPPMSPSGNVISHSSMCWPQQNIPALHLPGSNLQTSRLRSSLNARDIPTAELSMLQEFEMQQQQRVDELACHNQPYSGTSFRSLSVRPRSLNPSNLEELFSNEVSSPRYSEQLPVLSVLSPSHKAVLLNQLQQKQSMLSPIKTSMLSSPKNVDHPLFPAAFGVSSPGKMSPRAVEPISPMSSRLYSLSHRDKQQQHLRCFSSREFGSPFSGDLTSNLAGSPMSPWSKQENTCGKVDWSIPADELGRLRRSCPTRRTGEELDGAWVQSPSRDSPFENNGVPGRASSLPVHVEAADPKGRTESSEHDILDAWLEQLQLDEIVA